MSAPEGWRAGSIYVWRYLNNGFNSNERAQGYWVVQRGTR